LSIKTRIIIAGTGRSGTSFLMQLLTNCGVRTGFKKNTGLTPFNNAGMELPIDHPSTPLVVKSPEFSFNIPKLLEMYDIPIVFCPIRDPVHSAKSRVKVGRTNGGLWNADNMTQQLSVHSMAVYQLVYDCNRFDIPLQFIDFKKMMTDKNYLYSKLVEFDIDYSLFCEEYDKLIDLDKINYI